METKEANLDYNHDVFSLPEGSFSIWWPKKLSQESLEILEIFMQLVLRVAKQNIKTIELPSDPIDKDIPERIQE